VNTPAYYLVVDLEATCDEHHHIPRDETEIIELGAVLVDGQTLLPVQEWQSFVRPVVRVRLTPFCTKLTSIVQSDVEHAPGFAEVSMAFARFLAGRDALFCSWGDYDRAQLVRDSERHAVVNPVAGAHFNIKEAFNQQVGDGKRRGVSQALSRAGLRFEGTAHRGIDDARNIARLLPYALGRATLPGKR
jgi:inhibitor of KinA sporulation pathway (predicted exonuclease)